MTSEPEVVVLLWHGRGPREAEVFAPLLARLPTGTLAVTPQWDSRAPDGGRSALFDSLAAARDLAEHHRYPLIVGGWSLGAAAALSIGLEPRWRCDVGAIVGLALDPLARSPLTRTACIEQVTTACPGPAIRLAHGLDGEIVPVTAVRTLARQLDEQGHDIGLEVVVSNHAGILGTRYCTTARRCLPSSSTAATTGLDTAVTAIRRASATARRA